MSEALWTEAQRLEAPLYEEGLRAVDTTDVLDWMRDDWSPRYDVAAVALAVFADWNGEQLRATALEHFTRYDSDEDIDPPCGWNLLISAALISERTPGDRLKHLAFRWPAGRDDDRG